MGGQTLYLAFSITVMAKKQNLKKYCYVIFFCHWCLSTSSIVATSGIMPTAPAICPVRWIKLAEVNFCGPRIGINQMPVSATRTPCYETFCILIYRCS